MVDVSKSYEYNAVLLNKHALPLMRQFISKNLEEQLANIENNYLYLFLPARFKNSQDFSNIIEMTELCFLKNDSKDNLKVMQYSGSCEILAINRKTSLYGSRFLNNPILIIDTRPTTQNGCYPNIMYMGTEVLYQINTPNFNFFLNTQNLNENNSVITVTNALESYNYFHASVVKSLKIMFAISLFIFWLEILMIFFLIRLEYLINGMEIVIKKTLGHSCLARLKKLFFITVILIFVCIFGASFISYYMNVGNIFLIVFWGLTLLLIELGLIVFECIRIDKLQTYLILKGAYL